MFGEQKSRQLIIVCAKDTIKYGMYLMQLIGAKDDIDDQAVGLEDGTVEAVLWTEAEYESNRPTISSSAHVLFIGSSKLMMDAQANMDTKFDMHGMRFTSLGNHAVMYVDKHSFNSKEYNDFLCFAQEYQKQFEDLKTNFYATTAGAIGAGIVGGVTGVAAVASATIFGALLFAPAIIAGTGIQALANTKKNAEKIKEQMLSFLTFYAHLKLLPDFMEE